MLHRNDNLNKKVQKYARCFNHRSKIISKFTGKIVQMCFWNWSFVSEHFTHFPKTYIGSLYLAQNKQTTNKKQINKQNCAGRQTEESKNWRSQSATKFFTKWRAQSQSAMIFSQQLIEFLELVESQNLSISTIDDTMILFSSVFFLFVALFRSDLRTKSLRETERERACIWLLCVKKGRVNHPK